MDIADIAPGELVEAQLDTLIEKRARQGDPDAEEALWLRSIERYNARQRRQRLWERLRFHEDQLRRHTAVYEDLHRHHRDAVLRCEQLLGIGEG